MENFVTKDATYVPLKEGAGRNRGCTFAVLEKLAICSNNFENYFTENYNKKFAKVVKK